MWCVPELDEEFIERMEQILDLYQKPYNPREPVVCFDEKTLQLLEDIAPCIPAYPGRIARRDYEYKRLGTANIFCAIEPKTGRQFFKVTERRTADDFAEVLRDIERRYSTAKTIHLVVDNLNTHNEKSIFLRFGLRLGKKLSRRFTFHYTPKHASWLNQAEIQISALARAVLRRQRFSNIPILRANVARFQRRLNTLLLPFQWKFSTSDARKTFNYNAN